MENADGQTRSDAAHKRSDAVRRSNQGLLTWENASSNSDTQKLSLLLGMVKSDVLEQKPFGFRRPSRMGRLLHHLVPLAGTGVSLDWILDFRLWWAAHSPSRRLPVVA